MKNLFCKTIYITLFLAFFSLNAAPLQGKISKLLLHMDVNKTLIAADSANDTTTEQALNALLAEKYTYKWLPQMKEAISYQAYVEEYLLPGPSSNATLKKKRRELINRFVMFLQESHHALEAQVVEMYNLLNSKFQDSLIFPSFLKLLETLKEAGIDYTLILRTFGHDLELVKSEILQVFPDEQFCAEGYFERGKLYFSTETLSDYYDDYLEMYLFLKSLTGHLAIQDNWKEWSGHFGRQEYSKKFPVDLEDQETLSLFFDDNIREDPHSKINIVDPLDVRSGKHLNVAELIEQKILFPVDTFEAISNDQYFIDLVNQSLRTNETTFGINMLLPICCKKAVQAF